MIKRRSHKLTKEQEQEIIKLYLSGMSGTQVSKILDISPAGCRSVVLKNGFSTRSVSESKIIYKVNEEYFDQIDTEEKAYWIGMLITDGWVNTNRESIGLKLKIEDIGHLEKFKKALSAESPIRISKDKRSATIIISSKHMKETLKKYNIVPRKSHTASPPVIDKALEVHFWRGCIDGDGCLSNKIGNTKIFLCGTYDMCVGFFKFIRSNIGGYKQRDPGKHVNIFKIEFSGRFSAKNISELLYKDSTIFLDRKMKIAEDIINNRLVRAN